MLTIAATGVLILVAAGIVAAAVSVIYRLLREPGPTGKA
jgi:hypothetical protein